MPWTMTDKTLGKETETSLFIQKHLRAVFTRVSKSNWLGNITLHDWLKNIALFFHPGGGGGTPIYGLYRYVPRDRVWFLRFSILK